MAKIERTDEDRFEVATRYGRVRVNDGGSYRSYFMDVKNVPDDLKLALSLIGIDLSQMSASSNDVIVHADKHGWGVSLYENDAAMAIHTKPEPNTKARNRFEQALDEIFGIPETYWRETK